MGGSVSSIYYFCPIEVSSTPPTTATSSASSSCVKIEDKDSKKYFATKLAHIDLMRSLADKEGLFLTSDAIDEIRSIEWLLGREAGLETTTDQVMKYIFQTRFKAHKNGARVKFWRAKIALILVSDIENPYSRDYLNLKFTGATEPVFGIELDPDQTEFSRAEKMAMLKQAYKNLIEPSGDDLLEAECLMAQYGLRAGDGKLTPSQNLEYLEDKIDAVLALQTGTDKVKKPKYIRDRIPDQGYNIETGLAYWNGNAMRERETYRYIAQAYKLKAQLKIFEVSYNDQALETNINEALGYLGKAQSLVNKYGESPKKIANAANKYRLKEKHFKASGDFYTLGDFLNLISIEQMKASAYYQLALKAQFYDTDKSKKNFDIAQKISLVTIDSLKGLKGTYQLYRDAPGADEHLMSDIYFWRATMLGSSKMLLANIYLAQDKNINGENQLTITGTIDPDYEHLLRSSAQTLIDECIKDEEHVLRSETLIAGQLTLINTNLRIKAASPEAQKTKINDALKVIAKLFGTTYDPAPDGHINYAQAITLLMTDPNGNTSPHIKSLTGSIRLTQANLLMSLFYLDDTQLKLPKKALEILDAQIAKARLAGDFEPTPIDAPPDVRPNNGVFEDYELSAALQLRAEAHFSLDNTNEAISNYNHALSVYKDASGLSLNYFATLGLADIANWHGKYTKKEDKDNNAEDHYNKFFTDFNRVLSNSPILKNAKMRAELGLAEIALRKETIETVTPPVALAVAVIASARQILEKSDEVSLIQRALESTAEAIIAKEVAGEAELEIFHARLVNNNFDVAAYLGAPTALNNIKLKKAVQANLTLKVADGFLFIYGYKKAQGILDDFKANYGDLFEKKPAIHAHYLLTDAEIDQHLSEDEDLTASIAQIQEAGKIIFSLKGQKRDPYLSARLLKTLADTYIKDNNYEAALAILYTAQGLDARTKLNELDGKLHKKQYFKAIKAAKLVTRNASLEEMFQAKGLDKKWQRLETELQIKTAETLGWSKNYEQAQALITEIAKRPNLTDIQNVKILLVKGNIAAQSEAKDYATALDYYTQAKELVDALKDGRKVIVVKSETYISLADIYRYGKGVKDPEESSKYYKKAEKIAKQIEGDKNLRHYHLSRIYLGMAQLNLIESHPDKTYEKLIKAAYHLDKMKFAPKEFKLGLERFKQEVYEPNVIVEYKHIEDPKSNENRAGITLQLPFWDDQFVLSLSNFTDTRHDNTFGQSVVNSTYAGLKAKPNFLGKLVSLDCKYKIPGSSRYVNKDVHASLPLNIRRPDLVLSSTFWWKWIVASATSELNFEDDRLNTYNASLKANLGGTNNPYLQARVGPVYSKYHFTYMGDFRKRRFAGLGLNYSLDFADIFKQMDYNTVKVKLDVTIPFWEYEYYDFSDTISRLDKKEMKKRHEPTYSEVNRYISDGNVPWQGRLAFDINLGKFGILQLSGGGNYQETELYSYWNWDVSAVFRINLYNFSEILKKK